MPSPIDKTALVELFSMEFSRALGTVYAATPWQDWPEQVLRIFRAVAAQHPNAAAAYLDALPQPKKPQADR